MTYTSSELYEMFKALPQDVKDAFNSIEYSQTLEDIEKRYHLHVDQADHLSEEIYQLMLGITHPQEFVGKIAGATNISPETAKQIAGEVNEKIFRPIRSSLMKIHENFPVEESSPEEDGESMLDEGEVESQVPAPEVHSSAPANIAEEKLKGAFVLPKKTSGYDGKDPYHEPVN